MKAGMYMAKYAVENTYTVADFITAGHMNRVTYDAFSYKDLISNGNEVTTLQLVDDYLSELGDRTLRVQLSKEEYMKYRFKPKLMCHDIYGNGEVYFVILLLNGIADVKDFDYNVLKLLSVDDMNELMSQIYNAEYRWKDQYNYDHGTI